MTATLQIRWSEHEARKPYARPFGVSFWDGDRSLGAIAVSGADLLYYRQFQAAVLHLAGEIFVHPSVEAGKWPQRRWLDVVSALLPDATDLALVPHSQFDDHAGRTFQLRTTWSDREWAAFDAPTVLDYQEFQASLAHQTGRLFRVVDIEEEDDDAVRQRQWVAALAALTSRPAPGDAVTQDWPWAGHRG